MPTGLIRYQNTGNTHFITFSCYRRQAYLNTPAARSLFERSLETIRQRYDLLVRGYVIMPEHVHLLLSEPRNVLLAKALQALKLSVSVQSTQRPFWQARYYDFNVFTNRKFDEKLVYMHRNPVKRSLTAKPEDWPWSSFLHYADGIRGIIEIESHWTATQRQRLTPPQQPPLLFPPST